jgi:hypothetical protein
MEPNQPLDQEHVEKIVESMISNLIIADAANRICISMTEKEFYEVVNSPLSTRSMMKPRTNTP